MLVETEFDPIWQAREYHAMLREIDLDKLLFHVTLDGMVPWEEVKKATTVYRAVVVITQQAAEQAVIDIGSHVRHELIQQISKEIIKEYERVNGSFSEN